MQAYADGNDDQRIVSRFSLLVKGQKHKKYISKRKWFACDTYYTPLTPKPEDFVLR